MPDIYEKTMARLAQIPDNSIKFASEQGDNLCRFVSNLCEKLREANEHEKADTLYDTANKKFFSPIPRQETEKTARKS